MEYLAKYDDALEWATTKAAVALIEAQALPLPSSDFDDKLLTTSVHVNFYEGMRIYQEARREYEAVDVLFAGERMPQINSKVTTVQTTLYQTLGLGKLRPDTAYKVVEIHLPSIIRRWKGGRPEVESFIALARLNKDGVHTNRGEHPLKLSFVDFVNAFSVAQTERKVAKKGIRK